MRFDLQRCLQRHGIALGALSPLQQILLTTDGTVTEILEGYAGESMRVVKLRQETLREHEQLRWLNLGPKDPVLGRTILLQGRTSGTNFLYADSRIALNSVDPRVRDGLLASDKPIGLLLLEHRIETFKEILDCGRREAGGLSAHFAVPAGAPMIFRTYRMVSGGRPMMLITEMFPESRFRAWRAAGDPAGG